MRVRLMALLLICAPVVAQAEPRCGGMLQKLCFTGRFGLEALPGNSREKRLIDDFGFKDHEGVGWETRSGDVTNGASIPRVLHPLTGDNWDERYIRAAVIHDRYCDKENMHNVRSWQRTHRMFYDALIAFGVNERRSALMYYAVYTFGPSWGVPQPGTDCRVTDNCIQTTKNGRSFVYVADTYASPGVEDDLRAVDSILETATPDEMTPEAIAQLSEKRHPRRWILVPANLNTPGLIDR